jgi:predicted dehydrogenase
VGEPLKIGVVGCGTISGQYLETLTAARETAVVAVADLEPALAERASAASGAPAVGVDEIYGLNDIEWILDLTTPASHEDVSLAAINKGRSVYNEKPLCATVPAARRVLHAAEAAGVVIGSAPDTVLGTGTQTARATLESGAIGRPVFATATMAVAGHELWHPAPDFYYAPGGGPLLDMGPYYLTALVTLLGPVTAVYGAGSRTRSKRTINAGPRAGEQIDVMVDSHVTAICEHASGVLTTLIMSFDAAASRAMPIEVHGEEGSMLVPDPNVFDGVVQVHTTGKEWETVRPSAGYVGGGRGLGLIDVARSADRRTGRANAEIGFHVLDVMSSILRSAQDGDRHVVMSTCSIPAAVPLTRLSNADASGRRS